MKLYFAGPLFPPAECSFTAEPVAAEHAADEWLPTLGCRRRRGDTRGSDRGAERPARGPKERSIVGMTQDLRATRDSNRQGEVKGLNLFVVGCIEAAGSIVTSLDEAQALLDGWR